MIIILKSTRINRKKNSKFYSLMIIILKSTRINRKKNSKFY